MTNRVRNDTESDIGFSRRAQRVVAAGRAKADEIFSPSNIAVVDVGGNLVTHIRMDGAWIGSVDISINKAFTARAFDISTEELAADAGPGGQFYGIHAFNGGRVRFSREDPTTASRPDSRRRRRAAGAAIDPDAVADWLVRVAQMLLMDHLAGGQPDARMDRRGTLRNFVIPGILSPTAVDAATVPHERRARSGS